MDGGLNLFFGHKGDSADPNSKLTDDEIRELVAKPGDRPQVINHKVKTYKALVGFEKHQQASNRRPIIVESTPDSVADRVAELASGPSARQTVDILAEHLWWLTQAAEGLPFPEGRAARAGYWNAARKVLAQVGNDAWQAVCDACLLILREPTIDERKWQDRCSSPHGWIGGVVKRVLAERVATAKALEWYDDVSADVDAQALWTKILEHLSDKLLRFNLMELQEGMATWQGSCLLVLFSRYSSTVQSGRLEPIAERAASRICNAHIEVCFEEKPQGKPGS